MYIDTQNKVLAKENSALYQLLEEINDKNWHATKKAGVPLCHGKRRVKPGQSVFSTPDGGLITARWQRVWGGNHFYPILSFSFRINRECLCSSRTPPFVCRRSFLSFEIVRKLNITKSVRRHASCANCFFKHLKHTNINKQFPLQSHVFIAMENMSNVLRTWALVTLLSCGSTNTMLGNIF